MPPGHSRRQPAARGGQPAKSDGRRPRLHHFSRRWAEARRTGWEARTTPGGVLCEHDAELRGWGPYTLPPASSPLDRLQLHGGREARRFRRRSTAVMLATGSAKKQSQQGRAGRLKPGPKAGAVGRGPPPLALGVLPNRPIPRPGRSPTRPNPTFHAPPALRSPPVVRTAATGAPISIAPTPQPPIGLVAFYVQSDSRLSQADSHVAKFLSFFS